MSRATQAIIERTNEFRKAEGRPPVAMREKVRKTAKSFAQFMAKTKRDGHDADGKQSGDRICHRVEGIGNALPSRHQRHEDFLRRLPRVLVNAATHLANVGDAFMTKQLRRCVPTAYSVSGS